MIHILEYHFYGVISPQPAFTAPVKGVHKEDGWLEFPASHFCSNVLGLADG